MKQTTKDWLTVAEDDLLAAKTLASEDRLTNLVSYHNKNFQRPTQDLR
jgi:hypothetical protein